MLGNNIQVLRKREHMSQERLAELLCVSRQTLAKWESGESTPDIISCDKMAEIFDVKLEDLIHYDEEKEKLKLPPKGRHMFGTVTVNDKGQITLPKKARDIFGICSGDELIVLGDESQGLALMKVNDMLEFMQQALKKDGD